MKLLITEKIASKTYFIFAFESLLNMPIRNFYLFFFLFLLLFLKIGAQQTYFYSLNLTTIREDRIKVKLKVPELSETKIDFLFPAIVPGTYAVYDFGRFIQNFSATNKDGTPSSFTKKDNNTYSFSDAKNVNEIEYEVNDTWDTEIKDNFIFEPGGTNIEEGLNVVLNNHGFFGYFKGTERYKYQLEISKPKNFYPSTGLDDIKIGENTDLITANNYFDLVDGPIMYCLPDTTTLTIGSTKVLVSLFSKNKVISSAFIASTLKEILVAQKNYLGGELPVKKYAFIIYLTDKPTGSGASGALEHSYSSFYLLPEMDSLYLAQTMRDVAAHEFFHIVTPLSIHSEQIGNFDFNKPEMSKHLWLYEGLTEYNAHHMQVKYKLIDVPYFLQVMKTKMDEAQQYYNDTLPFTEMSKNVLEKYKDQYPNVYAKGALIGMCLDILLRYESKGKYGTQNLLQDLSKKFGKQKSFSDDLLFDEIEKFTSKEIRNFLNEYVAGNKPLPFEKIFSKVAYTYYKSMVSKQITLGEFAMDFSAVTNRFVLYELKQTNEFSNNMGFKTDDELVSLQGRKVNLENYEKIFQEFNSTTKEGDWVFIEVARKNRKGKEKIVKLKSKAVFVDVEQSNVIIDNNGASKETINIRNAWLGNY